MKIDTYSLFLGNWANGPLWNTAEGASGGTGGDNSGGTAEAGQAGADGSGGPGTDEVTPKGDAADTTNNGTDDPSSWEYDTAFAEAMNLPEERVGEWIEALRGAGVTPEQAAAIAELESGWYEQGMQEMQTTIDTYQKEIEADKYLSENWDLTVQRMTKGLEVAKVSDEFREFLQSPEGTVIASNPDIVRAFAMLGQQASNDKFDQGQSSDNLVPAHRAWYGNTTPESKKG